MDQKAAIDKAIALISDESGIPDTVKQDLLATLTPVASPLQWDPWIYRMVVGFLGLTVLSTVIGGMVITATSGSNVSEGIIALGSAAVGALAGLLAPSPKGNQ
ncbi:hypothetical protein Q9Q94_13500 [Uliginosibacterium sp. 31-16]|uniref:hypothetical protein n=1 Tax=Uliginosibacterium sp. 31-16 TaxID=3068315 RepID=UPI00273F628C|nr:hypothetical protein [Uliginosibacterium sp. 31-16]MDP5240554.1 hypothetical protein [Uliginosibacterium sp. 31-16]